MVDYSINDDKWNERKDSVRAWHEVNPGHDEVLKIAEALMKIGDAQPEFRKRHWASMRSLYATLSNAPVSSRRIMPHTVEVQMEEYLTHVEAAYLAFWDEYEGVLGLTLRPHRKSGKTRFDDAEDYAGTQTQKARHFLRSAYSSHVKGDATSYRWDGSFDDGGTVVQEPIDDSDEGV